MKSKVLFLSLLIGCGSGSEQPDIAISNVNTATNNNNSQNGDTECTFECEPATLGDVTGYAVSQVCSGVLQNGPNFFQNAPVGCVFPPAAPESEVAQVEEEEDPGLSQTFSGHEG